MAKQSGYLQKLAAQQAVRDEKTRRFTLQQCKDMMLITMHEDFGWGEELTVQAVGTTERGLIFLLKDCMKDEHGMNKRMTSKGGWRDSEMRLWLNETIIRMLPDELREMIVPRRIVQTMDGERLESEDKLWLPSFTEMFGKEGAEDWAPADTDETQLELFSTERSRVKERPGNGTWWYWLLSPYGSGSTYFCRVGSLGGAGYGYASYAIGVAFGFCL